MRLIALSLVVLGVVGGCDDDDPALPDAGSCTCEPPTAVEVTYDKASSPLGADNVQDAVDELAARPLAEAPVAGRLQLVSAEVDNPGLSFITVSLSCPAAGDIAIGGACGPLLTPGAQLRGTGLDTNSYGCIYEQPVGNTDKPFLSVMCLHQAP